MKRLFRILLISIAAVAILFAGGVWYLTRWLKAPETKTLVERELQKALKMPLALQGLDISVWGGVRADSISIQDGGTQVFESSKFIAKHRLMPLLRGRFVFSEVTIDSPRFVMVQRPDGTWKLPRLAEEPKKPAEPKKDTVKAPSTPKPKAAEPRVFVEKLVIRNGEANFYDKGHKPVASATGVTVSLKDLSEHTVEGLVRAAQVTWNGYFGMSDFTAGISNSKEKGFIIPAFSAKAGGGTISGGYARKPEKPVKYSAKIKLADVDLGRAIMDGAVAAPNLSGMLSGNVELRGIGDDTKQMSGKGNLLFKNGTCKEIELVNEIGRGLQLEQFAQFGIPEARAEVVIWNGRLTIKPLMISAPPLGLTATGTAKLDGKLDLDAQLLVDAEFLAKRASIASQFQPADSSGMRALPFEIHGSLTKPKHNLVERLTGTKDKRVQQVMAFEEALRILSTEPETPNAKPGAPEASEPKP